MPAGYLIKNLDELYQDKVNKRDPTELKKGIREMDGWMTCDLTSFSTVFRPDRVAQSVGHLTSKSGVLGSIPGLATYFRFSFRFFKKGSCQLLAKVCARSTG